MSASEHSPLGTHLQESIEQLIAETVRRSQVDHEKETKHLRAALEEAFEDDEEEGIRDVPDTERPQSTDDEAEPFIDPASPPSPADDHGDDSDR